MARPVDCGKTTAIANWAAKVVAEAPLEDRVDGRSPVEIVSLTKTAAEEIASRGVDIPKDAHGTLHALALRSLGRPTVVDWPLVRDDWNKLSEVERNGWQLRKDDLDQGEPATVADRSDPQARGSALFARLDLLRHRLVPRALWPASVEAFCAAFERWKRDLDAVDFTDMIDFGGPIAKHRAGWILADEAQDFSALEHRCLERMRDTGRSDGRAGLTVVGDAYQALYPWRGADPKCMTPQPGESELVLPYSYRVPRQPHALATTWIVDLSDYRPIEYHPRRVDPKDRNSPVAEGTVDWSDATLDSPREIVSDAIERWQAGETCMVLAATNYLADRLASEFTARGVPIANPHRRRNGKWNPLAHHGVTKAQRLLALLPSESRGWTVGELHSWVDVLAVHLPLPSVSDKPGPPQLRRGAKARLLARAADDDEAARPVTDEDLRELFEADAYASLAAAIGAGDDALLKWWLDRMPAEHRRTATYPVLVYRRYGAEALTRPPAICVGTIHSVKGGEADNVYLFPDVSYASVQEALASAEGMDPILRLFYVGMTRARERLVLCSPSNKNAVAWDGEHPFLTNEDHWGEQCP